MNGRNNIKNLDLYSALKAAGLVCLRAVAGEGLRRYHAASFLRKVMNRVALALAVVAMLPVFACHHVSLVQAQNDPLNNAYKPAVDCNTADYPSNIRLSGDMDKLMQTTGSPSGLASATVCETIYGTQNEWVDFQLHVQAPSGGYSSLNIAISSFSKTTGPGASYTISNTYRQIIPYKEGYLNIPGTYNSSIGMPSAHSGNVAYIISGSTGGVVPDPLIPFVDPYYNQTTNANPTSVAANNNQSYWFDILIPAAAPSGWYSGTVTVSNGGTTLATMPVVLGVWQWPSAQGGEMPSTASLPFFANATNEDYAIACLQYYGSTSSCGSFPGAGGNSSTGLELTDNQLAILFLDHRMSWSRPTDPGTDTPGSGTWNTYWKWLMTGGTPPAGDPTPMLSGAKDQAIVWNGASGLSTSAVGWLTYFSSIGVYSNFNPTFYPADEPGTTCSGTGSKNWASVISAATIVHALTPPGQVLITGDMADANSCSAASSVDIFFVNAVNMDPDFADQGPHGNPCPTTSYPYCLTRSQYTTWEATGSNKIVASYMGCSNSGTCGNGTQGFSALDSYYNPNADGTGVSNRAEEWASWLHNQYAQLYFSETQCWVNDDHGCVAGTNPWTSIYHFGNNGDGTLIYPSTSSGTSHVGTVSTPFALPSIRLELQRDGIQDYEYLHLLASDYSKATFAKNEVLTWMDSSFDFNNNPVAAGSGSHTSFSGDLTAARIALGNAVHQVTYPAIQPPPSVSATLQ